METDGYTTSIHSVFVQALLQPVQLMFPERSNSLYFKSFIYQACSVHFGLLCSHHSMLTSITGMYSLKWETGKEKKLSHFVIERSTNGIDYDDAGVYSLQHSSECKQDIALLMLLTHLTKASFTIV